MIKLATLLFLPALVFAGECDHPSGNMDDEYINRCFTKEEVYRNDYGEIFYLEYKDMKCMVIVEYGKDMKMSCVNSRR